MFFIASLALFSCSNSEYEEDNNTTNTADITDGIPVVMALANTPLPDNLQCTMYVFWKTTDESDDEYALKEKKVLENTTQNKLKFMNNELVDKSYRFLFIATPSEEKEIELLKLNESEVQVGDTWDDIMIKSFNRVM